MRFVDANVYAMRREWLMYARGLDGERLVALVLDELGSDSHVLHGLKLWQDQDFDHALVGPRAIFCIQTKNWRGLMTRPGDNVLHNGQRVDAMTRIRSQAMELKDRLSREKWHARPLGQQHARRAVRLDGQRRPRLVIAVRTDRVLAREGAHVVLGGAATAPWRVLSYLESRVGLEPPSS
jgi:hypothetical protein